MSIIYIQRNGRLAVVKWLVVVHMGELIKRWNYKEVDELI
jgi:hypothetical protein